MFINRNKKEKAIDISKHPIVKFASKHLRVYPKYVGKHFYIIQKKGEFFVNKQGKFYFTPLFIVVLVIEFTDVIFAADSVLLFFQLPAIHTSSFFPTYLPYLA